MGKGPLQIGGTGQKSFLGKSIQIGLKGEGDYIRKSFKGR